MLKIREPDLIIVCAGFDTHYDDPIGGMRMTENGYAYLINAILGIADRTCGGKVVVVLEGGYDLGAMRKSTKAVLGVLQNGLDEGIQQAIDGVQDRSAVAGVLQEVLATHKHYWNCFKNV